MKQYLMTTTNSDIVIMAAAVSDYKPIEFSEKR